MQSLQVLSETIANALEYYETSVSSETQKFVRIMDKFFDCLNVRNLTEYIRKRKPNLKPYTDASDPRLKVSYSQSITDFQILQQWLEEDFLNYFDEWEDSVDARTDDDAAKAQMLLSRQTLDGLRITGRKG